MSADENLIRAKLAALSSETFDEDELAYIKEYPNSFFGDLESWISFQTRQDPPIIFDQAFTDRLTEKTTLLSPVVVNYMVNHPKIFFVDWSRINKFLLRLQEGEMFSHGRGLRLKYKSDCKHAEWNLGYCFEEESNASEIFAEPLLDRLDAILKDECTFNGSIIDILSELKDMALEFVDELNVSFYTFKNNFPQPVSVMFATHSGKIYTDMTIDSVPDSASWIKHVLHRKDPLMSRYYRAKNYLRDPMLEDCVRSFYACLFEVVKIIFNNDQEESKMQSLSQLKAQAEKVKHLFIKIKKDRQSFYKQEVEIEQSVKVSYKRLLWMKPCSPYRLLLEAYLEAPNCIPKNVRNVRKFLGVSPSGGSKVLTFLGLSPKGGIGSKLAKPSISTLSKLFRLQQKLGKSPICKKEAPKWINQVIRAAKKGGHNVSLPREKLRKACNQFILNEVNQDIKMESRKRGRVEVDEFVNYRPKSPTLNEDSEPNAPSTPPSSPSSTRNTTNMHMLASEMSRTTIGDGDAHRKTRRSALILFGSARRKLNLGPVITDKSPC